MQRCIFEGFAAVGLVGQSADDAPPQAADAGDGLAAGFGALQDAAGRGARKRTLPEGVERRSHAHMALARQAKAMRAMEKATESSRSDLHALGAAWNAELGLRQGDRVALDGVAEGAQPTTWTHSGLMQVGWREVGDRGRHHRGPGGVGETRRHADALVCLASACQKASSDALQRWLADLPEGATLHVVRQFDPTPLLLKFGRFCGEMQPWARYLVPDPECEGKLKSVDWDTYRGVFPKAAPGRGVCEVMAQSLSLHSTSGPGMDSVDSRYHLVAPSIMTRANASVTLSAVEAACPQLVGDGLEELAQKCSWITLSDTPDNNATNNRVRAHVESMLPENVLYAPHGCSVHLTQRVVAHAMDLDNCVCDVHAVFTVTRTPGHREALTKAARSLADECLVVAGPPPNPRWAEHTQRIVEHTLLRTMDQTRGALTHEPLVPAPAPQWCHLAAEDEDEREQPEPKDDNRRRRAASLVVKYLNGDPRSRRLIHYETGCCANEQEAKDGVFAAIVEGGLLGGLAQTTPSKARWGSTTEALGEQMAGVMLHGLLPQAFKLAFPRWESMGGDDPEHGDDYRRYLCGKTFRATKVLNDEAKMLVYAARSWYAEPIDYLWMRLQWLDGRPCGMMDLQHVHLNPFAQCQAKFGAYIFSPIMSGHLRTVCAHYIDNEEQALAFVGRVQREVLSMVCQIYWRFELVFSGWPYKLTLLADDRFEDKEGIYTELWDEPDCCVDLGFTTKALAFKHLWRSFPW